MKVVINIERCKCCELCLSVCPMGIMKIDNSVKNKKGYSPAAVTDMEKCISCAGCAKICPDSAISVYK